MRLLLLATFLLALLAAPAAAETLLLDPVGGEYEATVQTPPVATDADGQPTELPAQSVGIVDEATGTVLRCLAMGSGETQTFTFVASEPTDSCIVEVRAISFAEPECSGAQSEPSVDKGRAIFCPPATPVFGTQ